MIANGGVDDGHSKSKPDLGKGGKDDYIEDVGRECYDLNAKPHSPGDSGFPCKDISACKNCSNCSCSDQGKLTDGGECKVVKSNCNEDVYNHYTRKAPEYRYFFQYIDTVERECYGFHGKAHSPGEVGFMCTDNQGCNRCEACNCTDKGKLVSRICTLRLCFLTEVMHHYKNSPEFAYLRNEKPKGKQDGGPPMAPGPVPRKLKPMQMKAKEGKSPPKAFPPKPAAGKNDMSEQSFMGILYENVL